LDAEKCLRRVPVGVFMVKITASEHLKRVTGRIFTITIVIGFMEASRNFLLDFLHKKTAKSS
jgi:hypothetical protein